MTQTLERLIENLPKSLAVLGPLHMEDFESNFFLPLSTVLCSFFIIPAISSLVNCMAIEFAILDTQADNFSSRISFLFVSTQDSVVLSSMTVSVS
jgi:hypothetical protein